MSAKKAAEEGRAAENKVCFYPAWCKRCGNCVAFCPRQALKADEWGHPYLADPARCTTCGLCEMLCPDFAITIGDSGRERLTDKSGQAPTQPGPERLAPGSTEEDKQHDKA